MFKTLSNSWALARECWEVLMLDKEMLIYPALTSIVNLSILAMAYFYFMAIGFLDSPIPFEYTQQQWLLGAVLLISTMYACHFSFSFFECALVASATKRLRGENPTLSYGLGVAANRIPQLAGWSFYVTVFGILLALVKSLFKSRWAQKIIGKTAETAWNVVTVFVLPLIVVQDLGATSALKESASLIKKKWGEAVTLEIGFGSLCSIAGFPLAGLFMASSFVEKSSPELSMAILIFTIAVGAFLGLLFAALSGIAKAVLFNYAIGGKIPDEIHKEFLEGTVVRPDDQGAMFETRSQP